MPEACEGPGFLSQQRIAYRNAGIAPRTVHQLPKVKVLFGDKPLDDKRRILNIPETMQHLRKHFPGVEFKSLIMSSLEAEEQLKELSTTTVFITPIGSSSFRLIYLPEGAHTILVGAPEGKVKVENSWSQVEPFREAEQCWDRMEHVTIDKYHVLEEGEHEFRHQRTQWIEKNKVVLRMFMVWVRSPTVPLPWIKESSQTFSAMTQSGCVMSCNLTMGQHLNCFAFVEHDSSGCLQDADVRLNEDRITEVMASTLAAIALEKTK